jgi:tRNA(fMet)-specific endonuclease VapC
MTYLLDTDTCVDLLRGHPKVIAHLSAVSPAECAVSSVTAFELAAGVLRCSRPDEERRKVLRLFSLVTVLPFGIEAGIEAARIRYELETAGQKIGPYDLLIAGHAIREGCTLVTHNTREFARVGSLRLKDWRV